MMLTIHTSGTVQFEVNRNSLGFIEAYIEGLILNETDKLLSINHCWLRIGLSDAYPIGEILLRGIGMSGTTLHPGQQFPIPPSTAMLRFESPPLALAPIPVQDYPMLTELLSGREASIGLTVFQHKEQLVIPVTMGVGVLRA